MYSLFINNSTSTTPNKIVNKTGNEVSITLNNPIFLDNTKQYQLRCLQASIVYCQPNITTSNNLFKYSYDGVNYTYNFPIGLYTLDMINKSLADATITQ